MARDYQKIIAGLRRKAADPALSAAEAKLYTDKANELEAKHVTVSSPFTNHTTTTGRDGRNSWNYDVQTSPGGFRFTRPNPPPGQDPEFDRRQRQAWDETWRLFHNQAQWNKPPVDEDDLIADEFKHDPGPGDDEDYGYDIFEGEEYE